MATTNYSWVLPTVGGSEDSWGTELNTVLTAIDTLLGGTNATEFAILDGATVSTAELNLLDGVTATTAELNTLDGITATVTELNYVDGVTSAIQTQLDAKAPTASPTFTGTPAAPTAAADTNTTQIATTAFVQQEIDDNALGNDQSWQDMTSSRAFTTAYQNTTGRTIVASIFVSGNNDTGTSVFDLQVSTDDVTYLTVDRFHTSQYENFGQFRAEIPDNIYYKIVKVSGSNTTYALGNWAELR